MSLSRYDIYRPIHKGLRAFMAETMVAVGRMDAADATDTAEVLARVRGLLDICHGHLRHEEDHVHPAMEARVPGSTAGTEAEHHDHRAGLDAVSRAAEAVAAAPSPETRAEAGHALYLALARMVGENLTHMDMEEDRNNAILRAAYTDSELHAVEQGIVASLAPEEAQVILRWIIPNLTPAERAQALRAMRGDMPAPAFDGLLAMLRQHLSPIERAKLDAALAAPADAAAAA
ncbi:hemerythrin domain-containing protein [Caenispirillum salinarum]|uniref:hemerythrin domain-containing protein n=1 Tax=Caenispirillum salinarum TaxID=859058 RepID=UPI00384DF46A